jgi:hypothetical protein
MMGLLYYGVIIFVWYFVCVCVCGVDISFRKNKM